MKTMNKVQLAGRLGMNPEIRTIAGGKKMARLSLAINERYRNNNGDFVTQTQWFNIIAWGKIAEMIAENFAKGNEVMIEGKLLHREYTDKTGAKRRSVEIQAQNVVRVVKEEPEVA